MNALHVDEPSWDSSSEVSSGCELLRRLSARTWSQIRDGEQVGIRVGEESITDGLLLDLALQLPETRVIKWNRIEEGRITGADWDWWFVDPALAAGVGLRIQAKRIDYFNQKFNGLDARNRWGTQRAMLERSAAAVGLHPLYCFYLASRKPRSGSTLCGSYASEESPPGWAGAPEEIYGCSLVGPATVKSAIGAGNTALDFFWSFLLPVSCLLCCEGMGGRPIERIDFQARRLRSYSDELRAPVSRSLITAELPAEVWALLEPEVDLTELAPPDVAATLVSVVGRREE